MNLILTLVSIEEIHVLKNMVIDCKSLKKYTLEFEYLIVVYFNQQMHACACIRMVENNNKHK